MMLFAPLRLCVEFLSFSAQDTAGKATNHLAAAGDLAYLANPVFNLMRKSMLAPARVEHS